VNTGASPPGFMGGTKTEKAGIQGDTKFEMEEQGRREGRTGAG